MKTYIVEKMQGTAGVDERTERWWRIAAESPEAAARAAGLDLHEHAAIVTEIPPDFVTDDEGGATTLRLPLRADE